MSIITNHTESLNKLGDFFKKSPSLTEINIPELSVINTSRYWNALALVDTNVKKFIFENLEQQPYYLGGEKLEEVKLDKLRYIEFGQQFINSLNYFTTRFLHETKLQSLDLPSFLGAHTPIPSTSVGFDDTTAFQASFLNNYYLRDVGFGQNVSALEKGTNDVYNGFWFRNNYSLKFLRLYYPYVLPANRALRGLESTPIGNGNGYIYVPKELVADYKAAENWSTYADKIRSLDDYPAAKRLDTDSIPDSQKTWAQIISDCNSNSLDGSIYKIGATKTIKINGIPTQMVIVGINQDSYKNGDNINTAHITWLERTITRFSPIEINAITSSNTARHYDEVSNILTYLNTLYNNIEDNDLKNGIKAVRKVSHSYNANGQESNTYSNNQYKLWIPSAFELGFNTYNANNAYNKYDYFKTNSPDYKIGETNQRVERVLIRDFSGNAASYLDAIKYNATTAQVELQPATGSSAYVIFGFCT